MARRFGAMATRYATVAEGVPSHDLVVMLDSADAFAQASAGEVLDAFRVVASGRPLVLGLETGCPRGRCTSAPGQRMAAPGTAGIPWLSYINGGFVAGEAWAAATMWRAVARDAASQPGKPSAQLGIGRCHHAAHLS